MVILLGPVFGRLYLQVLGAVLFPFRGVNDRLGRSRSDGFRSFCFYVIFFLLWFGSLRLFQRLVDQSGPVGRLVLVSSVWFTTSDRRELLLVCQVQGLVISCYLSFPDIQFYIFPHDAERHTGVG